MDENGINGMNNGFMIKASSKVRQSNSRYFTGHCLFAFETTLKDPQPEFRVARSGIVRFESPFGKANDYRAGTIFNNERIADSRQRIEFISRGNKNARRIDT
uniref:Uncharacterized protein n=1 Tax=Vespula pensylvanica TaxID=30213 RepID=A0A834P9Y7_VESPE|nr:hypothetical protein H0235_002438 [Vespula pensylvanica]